MATQRERLQEWRRSAEEVITTAPRHTKRKHDDPRPVKKQPPESVYRERLFEAAKKGITQHGSWLKQGVGYIEAEDDEETFKYKQQEIIQNVPIGAAMKAFDLHLPELGPYSLSYAPNGRHLLIGGRKGHLSEFDWQTSTLLNEIQVHETVRDVQFLHNHLYYAAAQKKYVYIYDSDGVELHRLKSLHEPYCLEFLPHHFLLCSTGNVGVVTWQDTTSGAIVAAHQTKKGCCRVMRHNPWNAVLCLGHSFGCVSMWTPTMNTAVAQIKAHKTAVSALAMDQSGRHLLTAGMERIVKVWDIRKFEELHTYFVSKTPDAVDISQKGLMAVGYGTRVEVWKDALAEKQLKPYLVHRCTGSRIHSLRFCPYEDILGIGHENGITHMLVPGAGEVNFDSFVADPFQTKKARREREVAQMMDKLPPDMIALDPEEIRNIRSIPQNQGDDQTEGEEESDKEREAQRKSKQKKRLYQKPKPDDVPFALRRFYR